MSARSGREQGHNAQMEVLKRVPPAAPHSQSIAVLAVAVLGVVYGDIGTSPIYALRECFAGKNPILVTTDNVLGVLSLIFWTLILVISLKYMIYVLRADNRGEGGTFALLALLRPDRDQAQLSRRALILLGLLGASMLYGGVMITPAISVLSAVEGLQIVAPHLHTAYSGGLRDSKVIATLRINKIQLLRTTGIVRTNQIWFRLLIPLTWLTVLSRRRLCHERRDTQGTVHPGGMQGRMGMIKAEKNPGRLGVHPGTSIAGVRQSGGGRRTSKKTIRYSSDSLCTVAHIERNACRPVHGEFKITRSWGGFAVQ